MLKLKSMVGAIGTSTNFMRISPLVSNISLWGLDHNYTRNLKFQAVSRTSRVRVIRVEKADKVVKNQLDRTYFSASFSFSPWQPRNSKLPNARQLHIEYGRPPLRTQMALVSRCAGVLIRFDPSCWFWPTTPFAGKSKRNEREGLTRESKAQIPNEQAHPNLGL